MLIVNSMGLTYRKTLIHVKALGMEGISKLQSDEAVKQTLLNIKKYEVDNTFYKGLPFSDGEKELYTQLNDNWRAFTAIVERALALHQTAKPEDHVAMMKIISVDCPKAVLNYLKTLDNLINFHKKNLAYFNEESKKIASKTKTALISISLVGALASLLVGYLFATNITKTIDRVVQGVKKSSVVASSAFTQAASSSEEFSHATTEPSAARNEDSLSNAQKGRSVVNEMIMAISKIDESRSGDMNQINENKKKVETHFNGLAKDAA